MQKKEGEMSNINDQISNIKYRVSNMKYQRSNIKYQRQGNDSYGNGVNEIRPLAGSGVRGWISVRAFLASLVIPG